MEWKPIKTAPKDGTAILLWEKSSGLKLGRWIDEQNYEHGKLKTNRQEWGTYNFADSLSRVLRGQKPEYTHWAPYPKDPNNEVELVND